MSKYTAIFKLQDMLTAAGIPFRFVKRKEMETYTGREWYQIGYPVLPPDKRNVCSVIQGWGSYGEAHDLLEIMGLLTDNERSCDSVRGSLTADEVFERIKTHYDSIHARKKGVI